MKALTICQPYAHLIVTPQAELPTGHVQKLVENRSWDTHYRGPLLIHAGKSQKYLNFYNAAELGELVFGAVLGVAMVTEVVPIEIAPDETRRVPAQLAHLLPWVKDHPHAEGPFGFCFAGSSGKPQIWRFKTPLPLSGSQGLFDVDDKLVEPSLRECGFLEAYAQRMKGKTPAQTAAAPRPRSRRYERF
jgi:hypothetical protein